MAMKLLGTNPCDEAIVRAFLAKGTKFAHAELWPEATACLETAALAAPAPYIPQLLDVLATYYVQQNDGYKLAILLNKAPTMTPTLAIGALVVERWRRFRRPLPDLPADVYATALKVLRASHVAGKYSLEMIHIIQALTVQLGDGSLGVDMAFVLIKREPQYVTEEMVSSTLALALAQGQRKAAREIVALLKPENSMLSPACVQRFKVLVGLMPLAAADGGDKAIAFLRRTAKSGGKAGAPC